MLLQLFERIGARRVQQSILWLAMVKLSTYQRLFDQAGDGVINLAIVGALFARDMPRSLNAEQFDKPGNSSENNPLDARQQIVAPIQRRLERLMPGDRRAMTQFQQFQPGHEAGHRAPDSQRGHWSRSQFDGERQTVQSPAHIGDQRRLAVRENEIAASRRYALDKELRRRITQ